METKPILECPGASFHPEGRRDRNDYSIAYESTVGIEGRPAHVYHCVYCGRRIYQYMDE